MNHLSRINFNGLNNFNAFEELFTDCRTFPNEYLIFEKETSRLSHKVVISHSGSGPAQIALRTKSYKRVSDRTRENLIFPDVTFWDKAS